MATERGHAGIAALSLLALGACSSVPEGAGFADAAEIVHERSGAEIRWERGQAGNEEIETTLRALLDVELDVEDAVAIALLRNRNLQALYEDLHVAQADLVEAGLLKNPILHLEARFPEGGGLTALDLGIEENFLSLFFIPLRKRIAAASFEAAKLQVAEGVLALAGEVRAAFYRLQGAEQLTELRHTVLEATASSTELARRLHEAGNIRDLDLDQELALHQEAQLFLAQAEIERAEARELLNSLMGLWGEENSWSISARLPELPPQEETLEGIESRALAASLALARRRVEIDGEAERLGLNRKTRLVSDPVLGISAERESESGLWTIGPSLSVSLPLFNQGQPAVARAVARLNSLQQSYQAEAVELRSTVRRAASRLLASRSRVDFLRRAVLPLRSRIVEASQLDYNAMQVGAFELLMAKRLEIDAGVNYVEELRGYWLARTELWRILAGTRPNMQAFP